MKMGRVVAKKGALKIMRPDNAPRTNPLISFIFFS